MAGINWPVGGQHAIPLHGIIQAVDVSELTPPTSPTSKTPTFQLWYKQFKDPELLRNSNGYASVVDEKVFSDLKPGSGHYADRLGPSGHVIGRVKMKEFDRAEVVRFLLNSSVIQAHIHLQCTVTGDHFTAESGDWFALHGEAALVTREHYTTHFDFGVHVAPDGEVRVINHRDVGRPPVKDGANQK